MCIRDRLRAGGSLGDARAATDEGLALGTAGDGDHDALARRPRCFDPMIVAIGRERVVDAVGEPEQGELAQRREVADPEVRGERGVDLLGPVDVAVSEPATQGRWWQVDE